MANVEKLIQVRIDEEVRKTASEVLEERGLTTQMAIKIFLTQIAKTRETPFDNLFQKRGRY